MPKKTKNKPKAKQIQKKLDQKNPVEKNFKLKKKMIHFKKKKVYTKKNVSPKKTKTRQIRKDLNKQNGLTPSPSCLGGIRWAYAR